MCIRLTLRTITEVSAGLFAALCVLIAFDAGQPGQSLASDASNGICEATYGSAPDFRLCEETETSCSFNVTLDDERSCADVCSELGGDCLATYNNGDGPSCANEGTKSCSQVGPEDNVCVCSRPDDDAGEQPSADDDAPPPDEDTRERLSVFEHQTDFLSIEDCGNNEIGTMFYPNASSSSRRACRKALKERGYRHIYLSVASSFHNYYDDAAGFRRLLRELKADGLKPVVWLTSDSGSWKNQSMGAIQSDLEAFIPEVDDLVDSYCLGIEIDEYWSEKEADRVAEMLKELSRKKVAFHQRPARWDYCMSSDLCDYMILQYGFGLSKEEIRKMTRKAVRELDRPVVAGEYNLVGEAASRRRGVAAMEAGASGFGNGGEPF